MPGAPQAKFEFVATGDDQVNAQVQGVIDKLVSMRSAATEAGKASSEGMLSAKEDVRAVGEALGTSIPRPLANIISQFQSLQGVLAGAGIGGALLLGAETAEKLFEKGQEIYDKWLNVDKAVEEYNKQLGEAVTKSAQNALSIEDAESNLKSATDQMNKFAAARLAANKTASDPQSTLDYFLGKSYEKDALTGELKSELQIFNDRKTVIEQTYTQTTNLINAQKQLNDITLQGNAKILADQQSDNALADAKLKKLQDLAAVENDMRDKYNLSHSANDQLALVPTDVGQLDHALSLYYGQADAFAKIQKAAQEARTTVQAFNDMLAAANRKANTSEQDDPYQKQLQETDDLWNKIIDDTEKGAAEKFKVLQQDGIDTTAYITKLNATVLNLLQARTKAEVDLQKKQQQELLSGGLKGPALPTDFNPLLDQENEQRTKAKTLIEQITNDLKDEQAQEQLLKDQAIQAGLSQLTIESNLLVLRGESADKIQTLVNQLKQLATTMHQGIGDPNVIAQADKFGAKLDDLRAKTKTWDTELKKDLNQDMENAFVGIVSGTETVSQAFQKMGQSILEQLAKVIYQMYIVKLLQSALGGIFGGGGGGDIVDLSSVVNAPSIIPHALGGPVFPGQTYLVGERGPELFRAGASGSIIPNSQIGRGGMTPLQVNIHNYGQPMEQSQTSRFDGTQYIVDVVVKNIQSNGGIRQALKS